MRELKFRMWSIKLRRFIPLKDFRFFHNDNLQEDFIDLMNDGRDFILQQFTGLLDNNWKDIYEGDILTGNNEVVFEPRFAQFGVNIPGARWFGLDDFTDSNDYEVIGNIYENPELLIKH